VRRKTFKLTLICGKFIQNATYQILGYQSCSSFVEDMTKTFWVTFFEQSVDGFRQRTVDRYASTGLTGKVQISPVSCDRHGNE